MEANNLQIYKLYGGKVTLTYDDAKHIYYKNKNKVDGVTSVLSVISKPKLTGWAVGVGNTYVQKKIDEKDDWTKDEIIRILCEGKEQHIKIKDQAAKEGRAIHKLAENHIKGVQETNEGHQKFQAFLKWIEDYKIEFLESERVIYSLQDNYCGTFDFLCVINGKKYLGDLKTGKGLYPEYFLQTAAYQKAYEEETGDKVDGRLLIKVAPRGYEMVIREKGFTQDFKAFRSALYLGRWLMRNDKEREA